MTNLVCFVAERNRMRQQVADRGPQRHATLPTFHKILLQYYPVLQSTQAYYSALQSVLRTTKCYSSTTLYYTALLCSTKYYSSTTLYYKVLLQYYSVLQSTTLYYKVLLCTTKYYSSTSLMIDPHHQWNFIYNARNNRGASTKSPTAAPATENDSHDWSASHMRYIVQTHQILRLPRKMTVQNLKEICWKRMKRHFQCAADPTMIREWSEHDPTMKPSVRNPPRNRGSFSRPPRAFWIEKYNISRSGYHSKFYRILRLPRKVTLELHQILRLPQKMNLMIDPWHKWNVIYNARSNMRHCPNSPNTAPATKNESHDWSLTQMKRYLQCAEQHASLSKLTKYCACHEKWISWLILDTNETLFTMRGATCVIVQTHQILRLPRKMNLMIDPWHKWNVIYNARSNMRHSPNSPNTAPATKNDRPKSQRNLLKTDETSFPMRGRCDHDPTMIRAWSEHDPTMKPSVRNPPRNRGDLSRPPRAFCIEKYNISRSGYHSKFHRILRLPRKVPWVS